MLGEAYLDLKTAAIRASVSVRTLRRAIKRGLPVYRLNPGGKLLIRPEELEVFFIREVAPRDQLDGLVSEVLEDLSRNDKK